MSESGLSHRGLMKMANAKLDYLIELNRIEGFIAKNGESPEINDYAKSAESKYANRVKQIYTEDRKLNLN